VGTGRQTAPLSRRIACATQIIPPTYVLVTGNLTIRSGTRRITYGIIKNVSVVCSFTVLLPIIKLNRKTHKVDWVENFVSVMGDH
jgi:hypothetical protein